MVSPILLYIRTNDVCLEDSVYGSRTETDFLKRFVRGEIGRAKSHGLRNVDSMKIVLIGESRDWSLSRDRCVLVDVGMGTSVGGCVRVRTDEESEPLLSSQGGLDELGDAGVVRMLASPQGGTQVRTTF